MNLEWRYIALVLFRDEPVDCVLWVKNDHISPNDYNPNNVAPPEKKTAA
ncbi:Co-activator of prophage gene expression IbrB [Salmonella enterica subsp. enterica]|uniref:Co-activator of prophage gene expression IbrB n=1 Tax=Salmonella enterica I TaxID=59201 RepID=A0A3S4KDQ6_SALET|nr:Co-activator of prophage gene expression IbrB [Salmonella enterica subsp. enterica]